MSVFDGARRAVMLHAHPDDETLATGVLIADLVGRGVDVYVATATRGERGEVVPGPLSELEGTDALVPHRERELACALEALGVSGHAYLGTRPARPAGLDERPYRDSGMRWVRPGVAGPAADADERSFTAAPVTEAAADLAAYAAEVGADLLVGYDETGGYHHPDHVQVHHVCRAAAETTGLPFVEVLPPELDPADAEGVEWLELEQYLPTVVRALRCHASQVTVDGTDVVHSGGQRTAIVTRVGVRRVPV